MATHFTVRGRRIVIAILIATMMMFTSVSRYAILDTATDLDFGVPVHASGGGNAH